MNPKKPVRAGFLASLVRDANANAQQALKEQAELPGATSDTAAPDPAPSERSAAATAAPSSEPAALRQQRPLSTQKLPGATPATASGRVDGMVEITIDPAKTRMNDLHRRSDATMSGAAIEELVRLIRAGGQAVPALGWRLDKPEPDGVEVILVYGARRRAATRELGIGLKVLLMPLPPLQADVIRLMHAENRGRRNYVPLEDAREYAGYLERKAFENAASMSAGLEVDKTILSRLLSLLTLPPEVLQLYEANPAWLQLKKGAAMASEAKDSGVRSKLVKRAKALAEAKRGGDPTAALFQAIRPAVTVAKSVDLKSDDGRRLGVVAPAADGKGGLVLKLGSQCPAEICEAITDVLRKHFPAADF